MRNKKRGPKYSLKTQAKGFLVFLIWMAIFILLINVIVHAKGTVQPNTESSVEPVYERNTDGVSDTGRHSNQVVEPTSGVSDVADGGSWDAVYEKYYSNQYPDDIQKRRDYIVEYLVWNYPELKGEEINNLVRIAELEDSTHDPNRRPPFGIEVKVCKKASRYANRVIELTNKNGLNVQDYCENYGETEIASVYSLGIFQILTTNFKNYGCGDDITNPNVQIDCAVKIYKESGYGAWTTSSKL